jgi:hypothetical protein
MKTAEPSAMNPPRPEHLRLGFMASRIHASSHATHHANFLLATRHSLLATY